MLTETFDPSPIAVINPIDTVSPMPDMPPVAVSCFSHRLFERLIDSLGAEPMPESTEMGDANGKIPVYRASYNGRDYVLYCSRVGAPGCVGCLEEMFTLGVRAVVLFGTCGVLDGTIEDCSVILPDRAVRDEGTSFHYAPASDEIEANVGTLSVAKTVLDRLGVSYTVGKAWTTDAFYRETRALVQKRKAEGCICVEMECSAVAAVSAFRSRPVLHFFYAADHLGGEAWDPRSLGNHVNLDEKERVALLAMAMAEALADTLPDGD